MSPYLIPAKKQTGISKKSTLQPMVSAGQKSCNQPPTPASVSA
jgi:hypothetical protein